MGRHRRHPTDKNNVKKTSSFTDSEKARKGPEERLGLHDQVCTSCNIRNPPEADKCRSCGCTQLRKKSSDFRGKSGDS